MKSCWNMPKPACPHVKNLVPLSGWEWMTVYPSSRTCAMYGSWGFLIRQLCQPRPDTGQRCRLLIADTALLAEGEVVLWAFTSKEGEVLKRGSDKMKYALVRDEFQRRSMDDSHNPHRYTSVVRRGGGLASDVKAVVLTDEALDDLFGTEEDEVDVFEKELDEALAADARA